MWANITLSFLIGVVFGTSLFAWALGGELRRLADLIESEEHEGQGLGDLIDAS